MSKIKLPEAVAQKFEFETEPASDRVVVGKPISKEVVFSTLSLPQAEALANAGKYLKKKGSAEVEKSKK